MNIFRKKWGRGTEWSAFESAILDQLQECEGLASVKSAIKSQRELLFELFRYQTESGYRLRAVYSSNVGLFPSVESFVLAKMSGTIGQLVVDIKADGGVIAEILVESDRKISDPKAIKPVDFDVSVGALLKSDPVELSGWVLEFFNDGILSGSSPPVVTLETFEALPELPKDYQDLVGMTDGAMCGEYEVFGLRIANERSNEVHHLIDLREHGTVCAQAGKLFLYNGDQKTELPLSFREVLRHVANNTLFDQI